MERIPWSSPGSNSSSARLSCARQLQAPIASAEATTTARNWKLGRSFDVELTPGAYDRVEFEIHPPSSSSDGSFVQAHPQLQGASVRVTGSYNGEDFIYTGAFQAEMEFNLGAHSTPSRTTITTDGTTVPAITRAESEVWW
jgi:hypothetical protein